MLFSKILELSRKFEKLATENLDAEVRNRGYCALPANHPKVKDNKDHFPMNDENQARNALARANQYSSAPEWYNGSLQSLLNIVARKAKIKFPNISITEKSVHEGKN